MPSRRRGSVIAIERKGGGGRRPAGRRPSTQMELVQTIAGGEREPVGKPRGGPRLPDRVLSQVRNWNSHASGRFLHAAWRGRRDNVRCPVCRSARDQIGSSLDERRGKD